jgi:hypothetical protein
MVYLLDEVNMIHTKNNDMQLIMEGWRAFQADTDVRQLELDVLNSLTRLEEITTSIKTNPHLILEAKDIEVLNEAFGDLWGKIKSLVQRGKQAAVKVLGKVLDGLFNIYETLLSKVPGTKARAVKIALKDHVGKLADLFESDFGEGSDWPDKIEKVVGATLAQAAREGLIPTPSADTPADEVKRMLASNKDEIGKRIRSAVLTSPELVSIKSIIEARVEAESQGMVDDVSSGIGAKIGGFASGASFMVGFGAVDNYGLWAGVEAMESWLMTNFPALSVSEIGMVGNTFSDIVGVLLGTVLAMIIFKITGAKGEGTTTQATVGVAVGCLLPLANSLLLGML